MIRTTPPGGRAAGVHSVPRKTLGAARPAGRPLCVRNTPGGTTLARGTTPEALAARAPARVAYHRSVG